jgi:hypothetical protein
MRAPAPICGVPATNGAMPGNGDIPRAEAPPTPGRAGSVSWPSASLHVACMGCTAAPVCKGDDAPPPASPRSAALGNAIVVVLPAVALVRSTTPDDLVDDRVADWVEEEAVVVSLPANAIVPPEDALPVELFGATYVEPLAVVVVPPVTGAGSVDAVGLGAGVGSVVGVGLVLGDVDGEVDGEGEGEGDGEGDGDGSVAMGRGSGNGDVVTVGTGSGVVPPVRSPTAATAGPVTNTPADEASASTSAARVTFFGARVMTIRSNRQAVPHVRAAWR